MNAEQKQRAKDALANCQASDMAALLQELTDAPEAEPFGYFKAEPLGWTDCAETDDGAIALYELPPAPSVPEVDPVAKVTGYYGGYLSISTIDGRVLPAGTALYAAPPAPSVPDMPLSMEQFGGLVGLARDDASEKAIAYKATNIYGETCYFGVKSTAQAWAKSGSVDEVRLRDLRVVATTTQPEPSADVVRDAWYGSNPPSLFQATAIYMALLEAAQNPQKLSAERILELFDEHSKPDRWPFGFARAIEREIFGGDT